LLASPSGQNILALNNTFTGNNSFPNLITPTIGPSLGQQHTIPAVASDTFALLAATQTFSGPKTFSQQITSTVSTGTAPFSIASTTVVPNLNAALLNGATFAAPGPIGGTTPGSAAHTTISASGQIASTLATGTAPLSIASTTVVPNLNSQLHNGLTAPASAIVGISDTQSLTNKTLTGASTGNTVSILNAQKDASAIVGNSGVQNIYTYTIPANTVANLKAIRVTASWNHSTGSASVTYGLTLNGQSVWSLTPSLTSFTSGSWMILNSGATTGDAALVSPNPFGGGIVLSPTLAGLSSSSNQALSLTFNVANTDQITPLLWIVELIQ
jgi:hypothetical protein